MKLSGHIALLIIGIFAVTAQPTSRILGGEEADKTSYTYAASVRLDGAHICGGSIIGVKAILTAAHCVVDAKGNIAANRLSVRVGSTNQFSGGKLVPVASLSVHVDFSGVKNDLAVLTLSQDLVWTDRIASIPLATVAADEPAVGATVTVAGWGEQNEDSSPFKLNALAFSVATEKVCTDAYAANDSSTFCLAHDLKKGSCYGDAGNGAVYNGKLVGVANFIVGACGSRYPDVFTDVAHYADWIQNQI